MQVELKTPIIYLITSGHATNKTLAADCRRILGHIECAVAAGVSLIQLREKNLSAHDLYDLTRSAAKLTSRSTTKLLVNDRADIAHEAGADGVHLTSRSLEAYLIRKSFGKNFLIGVSTHSLEEARAARDQDADFAVFGPVFETPSKSAIGLPLGAAYLRSAALALKPFPLVALGGITRENASLTFAAGASGVAGIRAFCDSIDLEETVKAIQRNSKML